MEYLYLLPFNDGLYFKIGITSNISSRVKTHNLNYKIILDKCRLFEGKKDLIRSLEKSLLAITTLVKNDIFRNKDGYTEIRDVSDYDVCKNLINYYIQHFDLKEINFPKEKRDKLEKKQKVVIPTTFTQDRFINFANKILILLNSKFINKIETTNGWDNDNDSESYILYLNKGIDKLSLSDYAFFYEYQSSKKWEGDKMGWTNASYKEGSKNLETIQIKIQTLEYIKSKEIEYNVNLSFYNESYNKIKHVLKGSNLTTLSKK